MYITTACISNNTSRSANFMQMCCKIWPGFIVWALHLKATWIQRLLHVHVLLCSSLVDRLIFDLIWPQDKTVLIKTIVSCSGQTKKVKTRSFIYYRLRIYWNICQWTKLFIYISWPPSRYQVYRPERSLLAQLPMWCAGSICLITRRWSDYIAYLMPVFATV